MIEEKYIQEYLDALAEAEPSKSSLNEELLIYLESEMFSSLSTSEKNTLIFCCEVIQESYKLKHHELPPFSFDTFSEYEEINWTLREEKDSWEETKNEFFKDFNEEDLLAFVEDILVDDEDNDLSMISKEFIFITCKSYIDSFS